MLKCYNIHIHLSGNEQVAILKILCQLLKYVFQISGKAAGYAKFRSVSGPYIC